MSNDPNMCHDCKTAFDAEGICPNCGNMKPQAVEVEPSSKSISVRSTKSHRAALSVKSRVSARPSTVATVRGFMQGLAHSPVKRRSDVSIRSTSSKRGFAAGLVDVAPVEPVLPENIIKLGLTIPEHQRVCYNPKCKYLSDPKNPEKLPRNLYRLRPDGTAYDTGFCPSCRSPFNFEALAVDSEIGQYRIVGPIAVGGCGFIYLAFDEAVGRHVILKGLLNSRDPDQQQNAVIERQFLAELKDPHVVNILNFVTQEKAETNEKVTYIVMEFIDGQTLKTLKKTHMKANNDAPLPLTDAIYYTLGILPAFTYLHRQNVIYCDFKMENAMVQGERLRLIDLGGARKKDDTEAAFYLTPGYAAPEARSDNPTVSVSSDLYTIGRTLAIMSLNFDWQGAHEFDLPTPDQEPLFSQYECFYRFLLRACNNDPDQRFQSAEEMGDQLLGVLNEIVAIQAQDQKPVVSSIFGADVLREQDKPTFKSIPDIKIDQDDPARSIIEAALASFDQKEQVNLLQQAIKQYPKSAEAPLRLVSVYTDMGLFAEAEKMVSERIEKDPFDYRTIWMRGRLLLAKGLPTEAYQHFDAVYSEVPGELAPKLALAICAELKDDFDVAIRYYELVSGTDRNFVTATFGLARTLSKRDAEAAAEAFERVPASSIAYLPALMSKVRTICAGNPDQSGFASITKTLERIPADTFEMHRLRADVLYCAVQQFAAGRFKASAGDKFLGVDITDKTLRQACEGELRHCSRFAEAYADKVMFINMANQIRPATSF